jgi:ferredoxin-thioredoxin reductase catalytic subunit
MLIKLNPNKAFVQTMRGLLKGTGGYCPCAIVKDEDTKCPCRDFREKDTPGECHCGLYVKEALDV